jgi:biotin operon repressor
VEEIVNTQASDLGMVAPNHVEDEAPIPASIQDHGVNRFGTTGMPAQSIYPTVMHDRELGAHNELRNNDNKILSLLNQNSGSYYSFKGLMRKLKLHQQSLARALNRLEQSGLITRSANGYRLNLEEQELNPDKSQGTQRKSNQGSFDLLLQTYIPKDVGARNIMETLAGRWFGRLRWIGLTESEIGYSMHWTNEENSFQVNFKLMWDSVLIETNASSNAEKAEAMIGSFKMFEQITKLLQTKLQNKDSKKFLHGHFVS